MAQTERHEFIDHYFAGASFDPEAVDVMTTAYDLVMQSLHDRGQPEIVKEVIAKRIVELAAVGEREPQRLSATVLSELGLPAD
jgi:hypothetical protein